MLHQIIQERIRLAGTSQAQVAEDIGCTPTQLSLYLRGEASLNNESLERCLQALDIHVDTYHNRYLLAKEIAKLCTDKGLSAESVIRMTKQQLIELSGKEELDSLPDMDADRLEKLIKSGLVDYEGTYPFFRMTVAHLMQMGEKPTPKKTIGSLSAMGLLLGPVGCFAAGVIGLGILMQGAVSVLGKNGGRLSPLLTLTMNSLTKGKRR